MTTPDKESDQTPDGQPPRDKAPDNSLTLKDYLQSATDSTQRTRFITIIMVVASVLLSVSVLNSWDRGWISLRLKALGDPTSKYTLDKFPLLCRCDPQVQTYPEPAKYCAERLGREDGDKEDNDKEDDVKKMYWPVDRLDIEVARLEIDLAFFKSLARQIPAAPGETAGEPKAAAASQISEEIKARQEELNEKIKARQEELNEKIKARQEELTAARKERQDVCLEEKSKLRNLHDTLLRSAAETKYTVRVPFFGVALDINDVGLLVGFSLWVILIMLRLSLRNQIVSLRIGFKAARASDHERWFYEILAARQVFVFPYLEDKDQRARVAMGWTEAVWRMLPPGKLYISLKRWLARLLEGVKEWADRRLNLHEQKESLSGVDADDDVWRANRNTSLRVVPKLLCLLPFAIYALQFWFDYETQYYGNDLDTLRTRVLLGTDVFFLTNTLVFGLWCVAKWNELDKLWDYFDYESRVGRPSER